MNESRRVNGPLMLVSLLLSILLWAFVYAQNPPAETVRMMRAKVSYEGLPTNLVVTQMEETILLRASGPKSRLDKLDEERLEAVVSLAQAQEGRNRYRATIVPPAYEEFFADEAFATLTIEPVVSRTVPIDVETQGQLQDPTLALDETLVEPETVVARGPRSVIEEVAKARVRLDLGKIGLTNRQAQILGVEPVLANGVVPENVSVDPKIATVTPIITSSPQQKTVSVFPLITGRAAQGFIMAGYEVRPSLVTIRGSSRALAAITQLNTDPVSIEGADETQEFLVSLRVPEGVAVAGSRRVRVRVMINPVPVGTPGDTTSTGTP